MGKRSIKPEVNLLELVPETMIGHETTDEDLVVLLAPRFRALWIRRLLEHRMKNPWVRVKLDAIGSAVWLACDGKTPVGTIADRLQERFAEDIEPCHQRLAMFLRALEKGRLLRFNNLEECMLKAAARE